MRTVTRILVTGGAGFIGSAFIRFLLKRPDFSGKIVNYDLLTYAGNLQNLKGYSDHPRYRFIQGNICDQGHIEKVLLENEIDTIVHFAAETHVDRSIAGADIFVETNVKGTLSILQALRQNAHIHFHHVSTDEVFGSLGESGVFNEKSPYRPNSPYSASKAASDHLVRAFAQTYHLSTTLSYCGNNFGPCQYPEKFIPVVIQSCLNKKPIPIYGKGANVRDWIYVDDHVEAIWEIVQGGKRGESYCVGSRCELSNLDLVHRLIEIVTKERPYNYKSLIRMVADRPGHDFRYALDPEKIEGELGWKAKMGLDEGLRRTVKWYFTNSISSAKQTLASF